MLSTVYRNMEDITQTKGSTKGRVRDTFDYKMATLYDKYEGFVLLKIKNNVLPLADTNLIFYCQPGPADHYFD